MDNDLNNPTKVAPSKALPRHKRVSFSLFPVLASGDQESSGFVSNHPFLKIEFAHVLHFPLMSNMQLDYLFPDRAQRDVLLCFERVVQCSSSHHG